VTKSEPHKLIDELPDSAVEGAGVLLRGIIRGPIDPDQAWFWTPAWQQGEQEAEAELAKGAGVVYRSTEDFISHLESVPPAESDRGCRPTKSCPDSFVTGSDLDLSSGGPSSTR